MRFTYISSDNSTSNATSLNSAGRDAFVKKVIFGDPTDGDILYIHNKATAYGAAGGIGSVDTSDVALKFVQPTHAAGCEWVYELNLAGEFNPGLQVDGGSIHTDGDSVTIIWDDK